MNKITKPQLKMLLFYFLFHLLQQNLENPLKRIIYVDFKNMLYLYLDVKSTFELLLSKLLNPLVDPKLIIIHLKYLNILNPSKMKYQGARFSFQILTYFINLQSFYQRNIFINYLLKVEMLDNQTEIQHLLNIFHLCMDSTKLFYQSRLIIHPFKKFYIR